MNFADYRALIDEWTQAVNDAGYHLSDGKPVPITFWKTFLGIKRKVHQDMYAMKHNTKGAVEPHKAVPAYYVKTIYYVKRLDPIVFLQEVKKQIPEFEADKVS